MVTWAALAAFDRRRSASRFPMTGAACGDVPISPGVVTVSKVCCARTPVASAMTTAVTQKFGRVSRAGRSPAVSKPKMNAGIPMGTLIMVATTPKKTASAPTAVSRETNQVARGSTVWDRSGRGGPHDQHKTERQVECGQQRVTRDASAQTNKEESAGERDATHPAGSQSLVRVALTPWETLTRNASSLQASDLLQKWSRMKYVTAFVVGLLVTPSFFFARADADNTKFAELEASTGRRIGVAAFDSARKKRIEYHGEQHFLMCSTFKVLAVAAVLKRVDAGQEKLDRFVPYDEKQVLEYAPVTREHVKEGGMTLEALCAAAISQSDNTAANLLLETIGGPKGVTELARALGDDSTRLDRMEPELNIATDGDDRDTTTPAAMCRDLEQLLTSDFLSQTARRRLEGWMQSNQTGAKLIRASIPADWKVGDKTGRSGKGATNDIAILRPPSGGPIFLAIYTIDPAASSEEREKLVADAAKAALDAISK